MFKQKNKKIIQCDSRITLDAKHNEIIKNFKEEQKNLKKYYIELKLEEEKLDKIQMDNMIVLNPEDLTTIFEIQNNIDEFKEKIKNIEYQSKETDYFIKTGNILYEYYNEMDDVAKQEDDSPSHPKKKEKKEKKKVVIGENDPKIGAFFGISAKIEEKDIEENNEGKRVLKMNDFVQMGTNIDRASKLDAYLSKIDKSYGIRGKLHTKIDFCKKCKVTYNKDYELIVNHIEGFMSCLKCGHMEYVIIESDKPNYKDPPPEATYFAYKRTNHLNEILNQIQAKESTDIPDEVLDAVREEIRKERIKDLTELTNKKVRYYLRKLNLNKYYEHIAHIINRLNGLPPPIITKDIEDKIRIMFSAVNSAWGEIPKKPKKNFLNYNYVLYKFVELLDRDEYKVLFPLLKSRDKIVSHDVVWKEICEKLGWEFLRTI
jgi:hypothetical protein